MENNLEIERCYLVPEEWSGKRLDAFLASQDAAHTRSQLQQLITKGRVLIGEKTLKPSYVIKQGERVLVREEPSRPELFSEERELDIVYEDNVILVVNKPAAMTVHPTPHETTGTLVQALLFHSMQIADAVYDATSLVSRMRPGIVHRLDKDTTGLLVIAKTREALLNLAAQFKEHTVTKEYIALVYGAVTAETTIHTNIRRKPSHKTMMGVSTDPEEGREAITHFVPVKKFYDPSSEHDLTLLSCRIETGRTHQIRVHCKYMGHPIVGDPIYTNKPAKLLSERIEATRQMLHAARLQFNHPETGERLSFDSPIPSDMEEILTKLQAAC